MVGVLGLLLGGPLLFGILNIETVEDIIHLLTGAIYAYVGFGQRDEGLARTVVGVVGVIYLLVGILGFIVPMMFGLLPLEGYTIFDNLLHLAIGIISILVAYVLYGGSTTAART